MTETITVLDNHRVARDGDRPFWLCVFCGGEWPWPQALPANAGPCVSRIMS